MYRCSCRNMHQISDQMHFLYHAKEPSSNSSRCTYEHKIKHQKISPLLVLFLFKGNCLSNIKISRTLHTFFSACHSLYESVYNYKCPLSLCPSVCSCCLVLPYWICSINNWKRRYFVKLKASNPWCQIQN